MFFIPGSGVLCYEPRHYYFLSTCSLQAPLCVDTKSHNISELKAPYLSKTAQMTSKDETTHMARLSLSEQAHGDNESEADDSGDSDDDSDSSVDNDRKRKSFDDSDSEDSCDSQDLEEIEDLMGKIQEEREKNKALAKAVVKMQQNNLRDTKRRKMFDQIMSLQGQSGDDSEQK